MGGYFDIEYKKNRLSEILKASEKEEFWNDVENAKKISKERRGIEEVLHIYNSIENIFKDLIAGLELYDELQDKEVEIELVNNYDNLLKELDNIEFVSKMKGEFDASNAILEINSGAGGTEAQDWAEMIYRMYLRWAERKGFKCEELEYVEGEVAGIKNVTILISGSYAYGFLRGEQGVHRLVRISPFDANKRRHTSFASVAVMPDIEDEIDIEINEKDLRIDTYRASGAGGQHINKTDSAVRITHIPTGIVVTCQNERSQHKNKAQAMKVLKARLYELEEEKKNNELDKIAGEKDKIDFGSQIRNYVLHPYKMVKDVRTNYEVGNAEGVLDGDLNGFMNAFLSK
ncbi:MAG: peptide chain release factor 2 [Bdellovibrionota bacterium]|nr:peptide chain release factor 2 [Pseudomonadota bacterium]MDY6090597.1 peptide chain release factor 2 [Bdellovibrionota bacterium]